MLWVTMKNGEIRRYNNASIYNITMGWISIGNQDPNYERPMWPP